MTTVLIVDDVRAMAEQYAYDLQRIAGFETLVTLDGDDALAVLARESIDCVILDLEMPGKDGFAVLRAMRERGLDTPVVVYTGTGNYDRCAQAIRLGAYSFVDKSDAVERVAREVQNAVERRLLVAEVTELRRYAAEDTALRGSSPAMKKLKESIARVAPIPSTVLIIGESGSGKELVARDVHRLSGEARAREPFIAVNCGAFAERLIESELFGHERGAVTGAFASAGKGTLFLDEIGELPAAAQAKLLRVLEERQVVRVGSTRPIPVPARVIAATHRNLEEDVTAGRFRQDLLYRLAVHVLRVPPLRDRLSDLPELATQILAATCERFGLPAKTISPEALELLAAYDWKRNNVRELRNVVERMIIAADGTTIGVDHVPTEIVEGAPMQPRTHEGRTFLERKAEAERQIMVAALERNEWRITQTAQDLGLADHASLLKIMRRHGISSR